MLPLNRFHYSASGNTAVLQKDNVVLFIGGRLRKGYRDQQKHEPKGSDKVG